MAELMQRIGTMVQQGDSALFVLARAINPDILADAFRGFGGTGYVASAFRRTSGECLKPDTTYYKSTRARSDEFETAIHRCDGSQRTPIAKVGL